MHAAHLAMWGPASIARAVSGSAAAPDAPGQAQQAAQELPHRSSEASASDPAASCRPDELPALSWRPPSSACRASMAAEQAGSAAARETWRARRAQSGSTSERACVGAALRCDGDAAGSSSETSLRPRTSSSSASVYSEHGEQSDAGHSECGDEDEDEECGDEDNDEECDGEQQPTLYGAARRCSHKRMRAEAEMGGAARSSRPTHQAYTAAALSSATIQQLVLGAHQCRQMWMEEDELVPCNHRLWSRTFPAAVAALTKQREAFLAQSSKQRGHDVFAALTFGDASQLHGPAAWTPPVSRVVYRVGPTPEQQRVVCREVFLAHYPISLATLKRLVQRKRVGAAAYAPLTALMRQHRTSAKTLHVIAWWLGYAKQVVARARAACTVDSAQHPTLASLFITFVAGV